MVNALIDNVSSLFIPNNWLFKGSVLSKSNILLLGITILSEFISPWNQGCE